MESFQHSSSYPPTEGTGFDRKTPSYAHDVYEELSQDLPVARYDYQEGETQVHLDVSNVESGQLITLTTNDKKVNNHSIIRVFRRNIDGNNVTEITALHTRTFIETDAPQLVRHHHRLPDEVGRLRDNYPITELANDIKLAKTVVSEGKKTEPDAE